MERAVFLLREVFEYEYGQRLPGFLAGKAKPIAGKDCGERSSMLATCACIFRRIFAREHDDCRSG